MASLDQDELGARMAIYSLIAGGTMPPPPPSTAGAGGGGGGGGADASGGGGADAEAIKAAGIVVRDLKKAGKKKGDAEFDAALAKLLALKKAGGGGGGGGGAPAAGHKSKAKKGKGKPVAAYPHNIY